jgi:hypothetical protein
MALCTNKVTRQWIVRNPKGNVWSLLSIDNPWDERQPFASAEDTELPPDLGLHKYTLGLPLRRKVSDP